MGLPKGLAVGMESANYKCPICNKKLDRMILKSRISHLKKCAKEKNTKSVKSAEIVTSKFFSPSEPKKVKNI